MKIYVSNLVLSLLFLPALSGAQATPVTTKPFGQADLQQMVDELDKAIPHNPKYVYPIKCDILKDEGVNAWAFAEKEGDKLQARMQVFTGFVAATHGDPRLIRACIAHELSHLSQGHVQASLPAARDVMNLWIRQQEFDADKYGAEALVKTGHPKQDMVDLMLFLDRDEGRDCVWLYRLTGDHADPKARAARISDDPRSLKALLLFDKGLTYEDAREHLYAEKLFDAAGELWPALTEASINAAKCSLTYYYDALPGAVRRKWWRPDFGPLITDPHITPKATTIEDQDRQNWKDAVDECQKAISKNPGSEAAMETLAVAQVLEPDGAKSVVQTGIDWFKAHATGAKDATTRLRYANNAAVGYQRLGDIDSAYASVFNAQKADSLFSPASGENLGRVKVQRSADDDTFAAAVLAKWLGNTPQSSPYWTIVKGTFDGIVAARNLKADPIKPSPIALCQVTTLVTSKSNLGVLLPLSGAQQLLGKPSSGGYFDERWKDFVEYQWHDGSVRILAEEGQIMRITSSEAGAYLVLKPVDPTLTDEIKISVGMTKEDLFKQINEEATVKKPLGNGLDVEDWTYFPGLNSGVFIKDGVVKAITVSPVKVLKGD